MSHDAKKKIAKENTSWTFWKSAACSLDLSTSLCSARGKRYLPIPNCKHRTNCCSAVSSWWIHLSCESISSERFLKIKIFLFYFWRERESNQHALQYIRRCKLIFHSRQLIFCFIDLPFFVIILLMFSH